MVNVDYSTFLQAYLKRECLTSLLRTENYTMLTIDDKQPKHLGILNESYVFKHPLWKTTNITKKGNVVVAVMHVKLKNVIFVDFSQHSIFFWNDVSIKNTPKWWVISGTLSIIYTCLSWKEKSKFRKKQH